MSSPITVKVTVSTVHPGPAGGAVFTGQDESGKWVHAIASFARISRTPIRGEVWQITGQILTHPVYGQQLHVEKSCLSKPTGKLLVRYLTTHPSFRGIGIGVAKILGLYKEFGERLALLLDEGDLDSLAKVINREVAQKLLTAWHENRRESNLIAFLDEHGVDIRLASKINHCWPEDSIEKLKENPYRLLVMTGWNTVDRLAMSLNVSPDDARRFVAAAEAAVYNRLDTAKETLVSEPTLKSHIKRMLQVSDAETTERSVQLALSDGAIRSNPPAGYQATGCSAMEQYLIERFRSMTSRKEHAQLPLFGGQQAESVIQACIEAVEREEGFRLNVEQRAAVTMAVSEPLSVLTGGAGVGKTTVLKAIHRALESTSCNVIQMALAGRAAQRMRETTAREAFTITAFLNRVRSGQLKLRPYDLLIIDESSMLDLMLVYRIVRAMPEGVRLLLVGDPHQLPPIGPGLVFHLMARSSSIPVQELTQVHRQAESTGIPQVACQIRSGEIPELTGFDSLRSGVTFMECAPYSMIANIVDIVSCLGGFEEAQVLGVTKNGIAGVKSINMVFHQKLTSARRKLPGWEIAESDPVIHTVNIYDRELYNGSLGRVEEIRLDSERQEGSNEEAVRLVCDFDGRRIELTDSEICNLELAYAITTHKAQGSQFKRVVIPITESRLLDRTLIYTALTRGIEQVVFLGDRRAFNKAIASPPSVMLRNVGFSI